MFPYSQLKLMRAYSEECRKTRRFFTVSQGMALSHIPEDAAFLRFDVERDMQHHLQWGRMLQKSGIVGTFYVHTRAQVYNPKGMRELENMGHEIGYHYECLDRCNGNFQKAQTLFLTEVEMFRKDGLTLKTACYHGEAGLPKCGYGSNGQLVRKHPDLLDKAALMGEVYVWLGKKSFFYASDTFKNYRNFWATIKKANKDRTKPLMILTHLHRWHTNPLRTGSEIYKDILQHASNRIKRRRTYTPPIN